MNLAFKIQQLEQQAQQAHGNTLLAKDQYEAAQAQFAHVKGQLAALKQLQTEEDQNQKADTPTP